MWKRGSALEAAADRSIVAEVAVRNGNKVCATLFDLHKFYDIVEAQPLYDSIIQTQFPPVDAIMGYQMHLAPRVLQVATIASEMIRVDLTLPGCIYDIPFVEALMHEGSSSVHAMHKNFKTFVDDVANVAVGEGPDVQGSIVQAAIFF